MFSSCLLHKYCIYIFCSTLQYSVFMSNIFHLSGCVPFKLQNLSFSKVLNCETGGFVELFSLKYPPAQTALVLKYMYVLFTFRRKIFLTNFCSSTKPQHRNFFLLICQIIENSVFHLKAYLKGQCHEIFELNFFH